MNEQSWNIAIWKYLKCQNMLIVYLHFVYIICDRGSWCCISWSLLLLRLLFLLFLLAMFLFLLLDRLHLFNGCWLDEEYLFLEFWRLKLCVLSKLNRFIPESSLILEGRVFLLAYIFVRWKDSDQRWDVKLCELLVDSSTAVRSDDLFWNDSSLFT